MSRHLIIFAKEPKEGRVKTRLKDCLSCSRSLNLYKAFLRDTLELAEKIKSEVKIIAYESSGKDPIYIKKIARGVILYKQKGRNLGGRMFNAFRFAQGKGASRIIIIGSDSPTLPAAYIKKAFKRLDNDDIVLGPSFDGGYYLIGLKSPCYGIFKGIRWSSASVFEDTVKNAQRLRKSAAILDKWYDVDEPVGFSHLKNDLSKKKFRNAAKWTKRFFEEYL